MGSSPKKIKLKRCPFCGGKASIDANWKQKDGNYKTFIGCERCRIWLDSKVLKTAVNKWNNARISEAEDEFVEVDGVWIRKVKEVENG